MKVVVIRIVHASENILITVAFFGLQSICSPYSRFVRLPGSDIPDMPIPQNMLLSSPSAPKTGYALLELFLQQQGRAPDRVLGDGNCLFRALSRSLTAVEDHHLKLRKAIAQLEAENPAVFNGLHMAINKTPFNDHLTNIKKSHVWGTTVEILAAASLFQLDVYVATDSYAMGIPTWLLFTPKTLSTLTDRQLLHQLNFSFTDQIKNSWIELVHVSNSHFDSVKALEGNKLSHPKLQGSIVQDIHVIY